MLAEQAPAPAPAPGAEGVARDLRTRRQKVLRIVAAEQQRVQRSAQPQVAREGIERREPAVAGDGTAARQRLPRQGELRLRLQVGVPHPRRQIDRVRTAAHPCCGADGEPLDAVVAHHPR